MPIIIPRPPFDTGIDVLLSDVQAIETATQRELTHAFIMADPLEITLTPRTRTRTDAGGWVWADDAPRAAQSVKVVTLGDDAHPIVTLDGVERRSEFMLLCEYDAEVAVGDTFTARGSEWQVIGIMPALPYEVRVLVATHGG